MCDPGAHELAQLAVNPISADDTFHKQPLVCHVATLLYGVKAMGMLNPRKPKEKLIDVLGKISALRGAGQKDMLGLTRKGVKWDLKKKGIPVPGLRLLLRQCLSAFLYRFNQ